MKRILTVMILAAGAPAWCGTGDVDNNGRITSSDALMAARFAANPSAGTPLQRARADVLPLTSESGDGLVTDSDVRFITRVAAGLEEHPASITVPIFAYLVTDDNGSRAAAITPEQIAQWVDYANTAYQPASVRLTFNPSDFVTVNSTLLNNMTGIDDVLWVQERAEANRLAAERYGYITVFFRHGPGSNPTGGGFSWWDYNFAAMPGFNVTTVCGHQNRGLFAHELGHYLSLEHTFAAEFSTIAGAEQFLSDNGGNTNAFNGDDFTDTPPDPFIRAIQCDTSESVTLSGQTLPIARHNIMSYWEDPVRTLTPQQGRRLRWMVRTRGRNGMAMPSNAGLTSALEADTLTVTGASGVSYGRQEMTSWGSERWNGGDQLFCGASDGGRIDLRFTVAQAATYQVSAYLTQAPDFGIVRFFIDGNPAGDSFDAWAFEVMPSGRIPLGSRALAAGAHTLRAEVISRNPLSTGYYFGIDCLTLLSRAGG